MLLKDERNCVKFLLVTILIVIAFFPPVYGYLWRSTRKAPPIVPGVRSETDLLLTRALLRREKEQKDRLVNVYFRHMRKCGGTTLWAMLAKWGDWHNNTPVAQQPFHLEMYHDEYYPIAEERLKDPQGFSLISFREPVSTYYLLAPVRYAVGLGFFNYNSNEKKMIMNENENENEDG